LPTSTTNDIYFKKGYAFSYVEDYEQSEWVAYELNMGKWKYNNFERPMFDQDLDVKTKSAHWKNYKKSGYTKGHLCPAGDRKETIELFNETFVTSNVSPQEYEFNDGIWNRLEQKTRYWAEKYDGLYVVTGGVLTNDLETIGTEEVAVPKYFYKVLMTKDSKKMIAFLVPHEDSTKALYEFVVSVDELEKLTKIDFFTKLNDSEEAKLESRTDYKEWSFK
jgi:endonuclease G, mitochondrial